MNKITRILLAPFTFIGLLLIYIYKCTLNLILPSTCIYYPTCSNYAVQAIKRFGFFYGGFLAFKRIYRCRPSFEGGHDPVPDSLSDNLKYIV